MSSMTLLKSTLIAGALAAVAATGALATNASADTACNRYGECWTVRDHYTNYPANLRIRFHRDEWRARHQRHYHWRNDQNDDHGYYVHGQWRQFDH
jgi:hypothetical protein